MLRGSCSPRDPGRTQHVDSLTANKKGAPLPMPANDVLPHYSGGMTFLRAPHSNIADVPQGAIAVVGIPQDTTAASRPGARWGPSAIRAASAELDYFLRSSENEELVRIDDGQSFRYADDGSSLFDCGDLMTFPLDPARTIDVV